VTAAAQVLNLLVYRCSQAPPLFHREKFISRFRIDSSVRATSTDIGMSKALEGLFSVMQKHKRLHVYVTQPVRMRERCASAFKQQSIQVA
jgi:hypothetical protein